MRAKGEAREYTRRAYTAYAALYSILKHNPEAPTDALRAEAKRRVNLTYFLFRPPA